MGLIKATVGSVIGAATGAIEGELNDQWLEAFEPQDMGEGVVFAKAGKVRPGDSRSRNRGTADVITDGSAIHVYDRQAMMLVDGGRITDFTAEPGIYVVQNGGRPTIFAGDLKGTLMDTWERFKFGGATPQKQQAFYVNLQEIKGIRFGTPNALNYFDNFYNAELFLRCHGTFSIRIADPILFYQQVIPRDAVHVHIDDIKEQYMSEFLEALQSSINQMSVDGIRISQVSSKMRELSNYMRDTLDQDWLQGRGMEIVSVGIASVSYDEESRKLIDMRNQGAMLADPSVREGYVQGAVARGMEAAGSNEAGAGVAFMGMGMGMQTGGGFMGAASQSNQQQMAAQQQAWQQQQWAAQQQAWQQQQWAAQQQAQQQWAAQQAQAGQMPPQGWAPQGQPGQIPPQQWAPQQWAAQGQPGQMPPQGWAPQGQPGQTPPQQWQAQGAPTAPSSPVPPAPPAAPVADASTGQVEPAPGDTHSADQNRANPQDGTEKGQ
ncbi:SPFH domain-containing protein [Schaalia sp. 19OD2882]|uniref:SPFH domain-containing protein n=1 Tax=Schaalia sp. 19OD2882 TaxID=2794089 RepID=UPI001C1EF1D2|nr:SPFH domain-containing protein [Schaalia sp. 19OD2882]QWW19768.1 SPFH domain-containing protein [Schaalia sp. 19OD2882]